MLLKNVKAGHWLLTGNRDIVQLSSNSKCPHCGTPNWCELHEYVYLKWWQGEIKFVNKDPCQEVSVYESRRKAVADRG